MIQYILWRNHNNTSLLFVCQHPTQDAWLNVKQTNALLSCFALPFITNTRITHFREIIKRVKEERVLAPPSLNIIYTRKDSNHWSLEKRPLQNGRSYRMNFDNCNCLANRSSQPWKHIAGLILICILMLCNIIHCKIHALGSAQRSIFASDNVSALNKNQGTGGTALCGLYWCLNYWTIQGHVKKMWRCLHIYRSNSLTKPCVAIKIHIWLSRTPGSFHLWFHWNICRAVHSTPT